MRFLADENVPRPAIVALLKQGFDVAWATEGGEGRGESAPIGPPNRTGLAADERRYTPIAGGVGLIRVYLRSSAARRVDTGL